MYDSFIYFNVKAISLGSYDVNKPTTAAKLRTKGSTFIHDQLLLLYEYSC